MSGATNAFVVMVTDGTVLEYAPEIYRSPERASLEAERWAWILAGGGWLEITTPFEGRWNVGDRDVRMVPTTWRDRARSRPWVCTFWTEDGYPDPEALILAGRHEARTWALEAPQGYAGATEVLEEEWMIAATYSHGEDEAVAAAHLAKVIEG
jgi:hypothetical protein